MNRFLDDRRNQLITIVAAALLVYANSVLNRFAYDDIWIILENKRVHQLRDLRQIWLTPYWPDWGAQLGLYRPLTIFLFALQWAAGDGAPWFFHAVNVLAHAAVCVLVYMLAEQLFNRTVAFASAFMFAIHPLHTEAVANMVGQGEMWAALGVLAGCVIYVQRPAGEGITYRRMFAILAIYGVTLLAKEHAVVLPGLLVMLDFVQGRVTLARTGIRRYIGAVGFMIGLFCAVLLAYVTLRVHVLGTFGGTDVAPGLPFLKEEDRLLNAFRAWPEFVRLLFVPLDLAVNYAPGVILPVESLTPMALLGILLTVVTVGLALATPWAPRAGLAAGWFLLTILPVSNFFFPIGVLVAERTLYLPSLAVCFVAGYAWQALLESSDQAKRRLGFVAAGIVVIAFGVRTVTRNPDWKTLRTVWNGLARDHPESYLSQWVYAVTHASQNRMDMAEQHFLMADRIWPRDSRFLSEFGTFYLDQKKFDKAIPYLERSRKETPWAPRAHELLAYAYAFSGRPREALAAAKGVNAMEGAQKVLNYSTIAFAYDQLGDYDRAVGAWRAAAHSPSGGFWLHYANLARSLEKSGRTAAALSAADSAVERAAAGTPMRAAANSLKQAIQAGCYRSAQKSCDPLQNWTFSAGTSFTATQTSNGK